MRPKHHPGIALIAVVGCASCSCWALRFQEGQQCTWQKFNSTPLLEGVQDLPTQVDHLSFKDFGQGGQANSHFVAIAEAHVAMCLIQKVASTSWIKVFQMVHHLPVSSDHLTVLGQSNYDEAESVFADPNSTRIVFVREPLDRLLSGFLDKCSSEQRMVNKRPVMYDHCVFRRSAEQPPGFAFSQVMEWLKAGNSLRDANPHFSFQASHCELRDRLREYNVVGLFQQERFSRDSRCVMKRAAGLSRLKYEGIFRDLKDGRSREERRTEVLKKFYTKEFAQLVMDHFEEDYRLFNIPRPAWVDEATGELFDVRQDDIQAEHFAAILATEIDTV